MLNILLSFSCILDRTLASASSSTENPRWPSFFEAPAFHLDIAKKDIEKFFNRQPDGNPNPNAQGEPNGPTILETTGVQLGVAANSVSKWLTQAGKDISTEMGKINFGAASQPPKGGKWGQDAPLPGFLENPVAHLTVAVSDIGDGIKHVFEGAGKWTQEANENLRRDPGQTMCNAALDAAKVGLVLAPGLLWGPVVGALGFGTVVGSGTAAAAAQSSLGGPIAAGSTFSFLQSAGAGGYGATAMNAFVRGGILASEGVNWVTNKRGSKESQKKEGAHKTL
ncbi:hypothetical protein F4779DRAFT_619001 [Xylariaceae sp. FL0662B]|nr:hypothetical protein F4779DRAFT_619001 [Xylariaceae sp. FL0662B]